MNKRVLISGLMLLALSGLALTSCKKTQPVQAQPSSPSVQTRGYLTDYGEKGMQALSARLHNSRRKLTHIVVIGDSHTAADFLSGQLRRQFQHRYGNGGIGFISPLAVPGNRYSNVKFSRTKGWQAVNSRRQSNPRFTLGGNIATPLSWDSETRVTALEGESSINAQALYRSLGGATLQLQGRAIPLADSQGRWELSEAARVPLSFSVSVSGENETELAGLWLTAAQPKGVIVSALGINGAQISMLDKWQDDWPGTLSMLNPDLVILAYGTNEAFNTDLSLSEYRQTLVRQIKKIRKAEPGAAIMLIGPGSSIMHKGAASCEKRQPALLKPIIEVQKQVARSEQTLFWDWFAWMGGDCSIERLAQQGMARPDLIHLTAEGYQASAAALWRDLEYKLEQ
ncbi:SGNH/GDSL hydrolase family protein [Enterobacter soli]|uniref:SGNH/GDSL hydrolase family protein n=1 Tax=Enterobacter soli TaxID=885040 RepID=UPI0034CEDB83